MRPSGRTGWVWLNSGLYGNLISISSPTSIRSTFSISASIGEGSSMGGSNLIRGLDVAHPRRANAGRKKTSSCRATWRGPASLLRFNFAYTIRGAERAINFAASPPRVGVNLFPQRWHEGLPDKSAVFALSHEEFSAKSLQPRVSLPFFAVPLVCQVKQHHKETDRPSSN